MSTSTEQKLIRDILRDDMARKIISELGLENDTPETQANIIEMIGENIQNRLLVEVLKALPEKDHSHFAAYIGSGDLEGLRSFLAPYIPDLDRFIQNLAITEYESIKTQAHKISQGEE